MVTARFLLLVYRVPTKPTSARVAVWRQLKRAGAVYLQQSVCVFPDSAVVRRQLALILAKIESSHGTYNLLPLRNLPASEHDKLVEGFRRHTDIQFENIRKECVNMFQREVEFETFRGNYTDVAGERLRTAFERIDKWYASVAEHDWFDAPKHAEARRSVDHCKELLTSFEDRVGEAQLAAAP